MKRKTKSLFLLQSTILDNSLPTNYIPNHSCNVGEMNPSEQQHKIRIEKEQKKNNSKNKKQKKRRPTLGLLV